ncbi:unnamed protein product [Caenorhabditis auriculariae]|uniref:BSD domain-containing protein n=1 Tax=Caenorhabditis auriculariae TaxID=2777116 RepID=A0A8S1GV96_9PELO|nr:unnamed protein product [Caenorhabditis auriculariae]
MDPEKEVIQKEEVEDTSESQPEQPRFSSASSWLNQGTSWGASFLSSAREKTMNTLDLVKKDLSELTDAMSAEVTDLASAAKEGFGTAANAVKQQAQMLEKLVTPEEETKEFPGGETGASEEKSEKGGVGFGWVRSFVGTVSDTVKKAIRPQPARKTAISPLKLAEIQNSELTYTNENKNDDVFTRWLDRFRIDEYDGEINMLLANNPHMRQLFATLVPATVSNADFWARYFYAVEMAEMDEELKSSFCADVLKVDTEAKKAAEKEKKTSTPSSKKSTPTSEGSAVVVEEPTSPSQSSDWSVCSEKNVEEILSNDEDETGPLTPRPSTDTPAAKEDGWVDWDE